MLLGISLLAPSDIIEQFRNRGRAETFATVRDSFTNIVLPVRDRVLSRVTVDGSGKHSDKGSESGSMDPRVCAVPVGSAVGQPAVQWASRQCAVLLLLQ